MALDRTGFVFLPPSQLGKPSPLLADNIDPATKDFASLFVGADPVDACVQVALSTTRGSGPSVANVGLKVARRKITTDFDSVTEADARNALAPLIQRRDIDLIGITPDTRDAEQFSQMVVKYRNLRAFDPRPRTSPLASGGT